MELRLAVFLLTIAAWLPPTWAQDVSAIIARGDSLLRADQPQRALTSYDIAIEVSPEARCYVARARALYMLDHMDAFLLDVERALRLDSTNAEAHYQRALYAMRGQDPHRVVKECSSSLAHGVQDPLRRDVLVLRGEALASLGRDNEAIEDLRAGLTPDSKDAEALATLSRMLDATGRHEEALSILEQLCQLEPENVGHWTNRGYELAALGRNDEALAMYDTALELDKDEPVALSNRAQTLLQLGREEEAMKNVERSLRAYPSNAAALRTRGVLLLHKGEHEKACKDFHSARVLGGVDDVDTLIEQNCAGASAPR